MHAHPTLETATMSLTVPAEAHSSRPTMIVLVHGPWADSTSRDKSPGNSAATATAP